MSDHSDDPEFEEFERAVDALRTEITEVINKHGGSRS